VADAPPQAGADLAPRPASSTGDLAGRGLTTVSGRALRSVAAAAAAAALGVPRRDVHVDLSDDGGLLAVVVRTPVVVADDAAPAGGNDETDDGTDDGAEGTVVARAEAARRRVARDLADLAGAGVGSCRLVVTSVEVTTRGRTGRTEGLL
jgi:hypothetical protein